MSHLRIDELNLLFSNGNRANVKALNSLRRRYEIIGDLPGIRPDLDPIFYFRLDLTTSGQKQNGRREFARF